MEHNIIARNYGDKFIFFFFFLLIYFGLLLFEVFISVEIIYVAGSLCALVLAMIDNKGNGTKDFVVYLLYVLSAVAAVFIFNYTMELIAGKSIAESRLVVIVIVGIGIVPGYLLIKIYQSFVNRRLEDAYWADFDAKQGNKKD